MVYGMAKRVKRAGLIHDGVLLHELGVPRRVPSEERRGLVPGKQKEIYHR